MESDKRVVDKKDLAINYITDKVPIIFDTYSISQANKYINKNIKQFDVIDYIYVVNNRNDLVGVLSVKDIFKHSGKIKVKEVMQKEIISVNPDTEQVKVANIALKHGLKAIPIVEKNKLIGVILTNKILSIINRSLHKNILYFAGIHKDHLDFEDTSQVPLYLSLFHRVPWLIIGLLGVIFAAFFINKFEDIINRHLILAFFIPAIVYMSGALGTQNQTLLIRDFAVFGKELKFAKYFFKQLTIGFIIALFIGGLVYIIVSLIWNETYIAFVIGTAMFFTLVISSFSSMLVTYLFKVFKQDPALGSGPFATIISDVSSIIVYFIIVSIMIK